MTLQANIKEVHVRLRRGEQRVDVFWGEDGKCATWKEDGWVEGADVPDAVKADVRAVATWLTRTVAKAHAEASK